VKRKREIAKMSKSGKMSRRDFLRKAGGGTAVAGALGAAGCATTPAGEPGKPIQVAQAAAPKTGTLVEPGAKIRVGHIGCGGQGTHHLKQMVERVNTKGDVEIKAVCDVYKRRENRAKGMSGADSYRKYKDLISRDDIDAVVIATPDHWHAQNALDAMDAGKDVYVEKPVTLTVDEARKIRDKVQETGRVFQCGAQRCSDDFWWQVRDFIKKGGIGKVLWAQGDYSRNSGNPARPQGGEWNYSIDRQATADDPQSDFYIDWDLWLGPARKRPFSKPRFFQFRKFWDYSGGIATDLLYHLLAPMTIGLDTSFPERVTASGGIYVQQDDREVPDTYMSQIDYPDDYTIVLTSSMANKQGLPTIIRGHRATIRPTDGGARVTAEDEFKGWFKKEFGAEEIVLRVKPRMGHMDNFLHCVRTREKCHCDAETAYRAMAGIKLGVESYRQDKVMFFDAKKERTVSSHPRPSRTSKYPTVKS